MLTTWSYDPAGHLASELEWRLPGSGDDWLATYTYDDAGNMTMEEDDQLLDGWIEIRYLWTYDAAGHVLREAADQPADFHPEFFTDFTHDAQGRVKTQHDYDRWNDYDTRLWWEYDPSGLRTVQYGIAGPGPPPYEYVCQKRVWTYDAAGHELTDRIYDCDGSPIAGGPPRYTHIYDAAGNLTRMEVDGWPYGSVDEYVDMTYDARGNMLTRDEVDVFYDPYLVYPVKSEYFTYDCD